MARCQYAWSLNTVAKFPIMLMTPKISPDRWWSNVQVLRITIKEQSVPFLDLRVRYEAPAYPETGVLSEAAVSNLCIFEIEPIFGDVA